MSISNFTLDARFYDDLLDRIEEERAKSNRINSKLQFTEDDELYVGSETEADDSISIPSRVHLQELVEITFWASLQKEEGRPLTFSVGYIAPTGERSEIIFKDARPFNVHNLVKLAPSVGRSRTEIGVFTNEHGQLQIWGLIPNELVPLPTATINLKVLDPGQVILKYQINNVALISGAQTYLIDNKLVDPGSSIWDKFLQERIGVDDSDEAQGGELSRKIDVILDMIQAMRKLGHGGAIIIVPDDGAWQNHTDDLTYLTDLRFTSISNCLKHITEAWRAQTNMLGVFRNRLLELSKNIAGLTAVDGVVLMTKQLDLIAFGVKLKEAGEDFEVVEIDLLEYENRGRVTSVKKLGGKRHLSAARFIYKNRDALAFVASQDGNITLLVWEDNQYLGLQSVFAYRRLELMLFRLF